jgi:hypothetical protein
MANVQKQFKRKTIRGAVGENKERKAVCSWRGTVPRGPGVEVP